MLVLAALGLLLGRVAGSEVVDLTDETFEDFITEHETTMVRSHPHERSEGQQATSSRASSQPVCVWCVRCLYLGLRIGC